MTYDVPQSQKLKEVAHGLLGGQGESTRQLPCTAVLPAGEAENDTRQHLLPSVPPGWGGKRKRKDS